MIWFVLQVALNSEFLVEFDLLRLGYTPKTLTHTVIKKHRRYKRRMEVTTPLFPGYMFFGREHEEINWQEVLAIPGVHGVLEGAKGSSEFSPVEIDNNRMLVIERLAESDTQLSGAPALQHFFDVGEKVRVSNGLLSGYQGEVVDRKRDYAAVDLENGRRVTLNTGSLEALGEA